MTIFIILFLLIAIILFYFYENKQENYSNAAFDQLVSKGPIDNYLYGDVSKYIPFFNIYDPSFILNRYNIFDSVGPWHNYTKPYKNNYYYYPLYYYNNFPYHYNNIPYYS